MSPHFIERMFFLAFRPGRAAVGHTIIGRLPKSERWRVVVDLLRGPTLDTRAIAGATVKAADGRLKELSSDPSLSYCFWLLVRLANAAHGPNFVADVGRLGVKIQSSDTALSAIARVADRAQTELNRHPESGPFGELAALALRRALLETVGSEGRSLFGSSLEDLEHAFRRHSSAAQFGELTKLFFGDFYARTLRFYVDRELSNSVGTGGGAGNRGRRRRFHHGVGPARSAIGGDRRNVCGWLVLETVLGTRGGHPRRRCPAVRGPRPDEAPQGAAPRFPMSGHDVVHALFRCDGAAVPSAWSTSSWELDRPILTRGKDQDLDLKVESLAAKVVGLIDARAADLVRIAGYAYAADQMLSRGGPIDVHRKDWRRRLALCVPVSDPAFWTDPAQGGALREALGFLTDDEWDFAFDRAAPEASQLPLDLPALPAVETPDAIVLLSGGTDSLCALVAHVAAGGRPLVVSHRSAPQLDRWQRDLLQAVRGKFPSWRFPQLSFWVQRRRGDAANSARLRCALLFAALGAAVAGQIGVPSVLLPDNGYVSVNPSISGQLVGALASRSTHPKFLRLFNRLVEGAFPDPVQVCNPLADATRAEALEVLEPNGCGELLAATHSCGNHRGRTNAVPHCGGCSQCVDRRFSSVAAGLEEYDPAGRYGLDVFVAPLSEGEPRTVAESYVRFARATERATDDDLLKEHLQWLDALDPDDPGFGEAGLRLLDLMRRHADEVVGVFGDMIGRYKRPLARGELSPNSLLPMVLGVNREALSRELGEPEARPFASEDGPDRTPAAENVFVREHGVWHVSFRGRKGTYPRSRGMERLARLLAAQGRGISSLELMKGPSAKPATNDGAGVFIDEGLRPTDPGALGEIIDEPYEQGLKARAQELAVEIARARDVGDDEAVENALSELRWIERQWRGGRGMGGRRRRFSDEHEAARKAVQKSVAPVIAGFAATLPEMHEHLDRWVTLGATCRYDPVPKERWRVAM